MNDNWQALAPQSCDCGDLDGRCASSKDVNGRTTLGVHDGTAELGLLKALRASNGPGCEGGSRVLRRARDTGGDYQFAFWALRTKAASSALKRTASSKNGEWPMP